MHTNFSVPVWVGGRKEDLEIVFQAAPFFAWWGRRPEKWRIYSAEMRWRPGRACLFLPGPRLAEGHGTHSGACSLWELAWGWVSRKQCSWANQERLDYQLHYSQMSALKARRQHDTTNPALGNRGKIEGIVTKNLGFSHSHEDVKLSFLPFCVRTVWGESIGRETMLKDQGFSSWWGIIS